MNRCIRFASYCCFDVDFLLNSIDILSFVSMVAEQTQWFCVKIKSVTGPQEHISQSNTKRDFRYFDLTNED